MSSCPPINPPAHEPAAQGEAAPGPAQLILVHQAVGEGEQRQPRPVPEMARERWTAPTETNRLSQEKARFVAFAHFHGINTLTWLMSNCQCDDIAARGLGELPTLGSHEPRMRGPVALRLHLKGGVGRSDQHPQAQRPGRL